MLSTMSNLPIVAGISTTATTGTTSTTTASTSTSGSVNTTATNNNNNTSASNSTSASSTTANGGTSTNSGNSLQYYYTGNNTSNSVDGNKYSLPSIYFTPQDSINNTSHTYNPYTTVSGAVTPQNYQLDYSQSSTVNNNYQFTLPNQQLSSPQQQQYNRSYSNSLMPNYHYNNTTTNINANVGSNTSPQLSNSNTPNPISPVLIPDKDNTYNNTNNVLVSSYPSMTMNQIQQQQQQYLQPSQQYQYLYNQYYMQPYYHNPQQLAPQQVQKPAQTEKLPHLSVTNIDYSSLVSYTVSPSLKRKRRTAKKSLSPSSTSSLSMMINHDSTNNGTTSTATTTRSSSTSSATSSSIGVAAADSFPCPQCNKVFQKPYNLKSHMKTHSNEKPYHCNICFKRFARLHDKKRHELLHQGVKNFKCQGYLNDGVTSWGCGKTFARSDALSRHFRTETGWLCIRPLMEEAKRLEEEEQQRQQQAQQQQQVPQQSQVSEQIGVNVGEIKFNDEYYDNSNFIKKLLQSNK